MKYRIIEYSSNGIYLCDTWHMFSDIDDCLTKGCDAQGTMMCVDGINNATCVCNQGYSGELCESELLRIHIFTLYVYENIECMCEPQFEQRELLI